MNEYRYESGVHFLRLKGSFVERAVRHAQLLKEQIRNGAIPALAKKNEWIIRRGPGIVQIPAVMRSILWVYERALGHMDRSNTPVSREVLRVMSRETGLDYKMFRNALFQAESLMLISRFSIMKHVMGELPQGSLPGCSSAVATGEWTESGRMLVSRNMDYPIVGPWEKHPVVIFHEPTDASEIPHVSVTSAGVHASGLTSMNREGITLASHAHFGRKVALTGTPVLDIGNEIICRAKSIGEAVDIARKHPRFVNWAFVVSSAKENDAVVIEMSPRCTRVTPATDGILVHSNYFHSPDLQGSEALVSGGCTSDLAARVCRMRNLLKESRGRLTPELMGNALGDHVDWETGEERVFGTTLSVVTTVKSAVFDPAEQRFWVSSRTESPTGLGPYLEVGVNDFWEKNEAPRAFGGYQPRNANLFDGVKLYREAYQAWHMDAHDPRYAEKTLDKLREALKVYPDDGNLWTQAGLVAFRMKIFDAARAYFDQALSRNLGEHTKHVCKLFLARCLDLTGKRAEALAIYRTHGEVVNPKLRRAFKKGLRRAYHQKLTNFMMLDLQWPDAIEY